MLTDKVVVLAVGGAYVEATVQTCRWVPPLWEGSEGTWAYTVKFEDKRLADAEYLEASVTYALQLFDQRHLCV